MGQVVVTLNGRTYRLECNEGEEAHLLGLSEYIGAHVDDMRRKFGQVGDDRLILMASLLVTDELWAMRTELDDLRAQLADARRDKSESDENARSVEAQLFAKFGEAAARLEGLNARFAGGGR
ncbi:cell division protein ZapA [Methyloceanibacter sp.]|uniref:cell division protein ZapA n=1 Tax=Methyloceanibacter sp. TaxID=1965321 RepID=UPI002BA0CA8A|nr:cell division protein ZapA [Methyloceanibacter sp.]HML93683.1 cell division protein ZapA [Methyloceanibacter sp.]